MSQDSNSITRSFSSESNDKVSIDSPPPVAELQTGSSRLERKNFPSAIAKSASDSKSKATPKNLRFRLISPSSSNASNASFELNQPVIVKPLAAPGPVTVKGLSSGIPSSEFSRPQKKLSLVANPNGSDFAGEFHRAVVTGTPANIEFLMNGQRPSSSSDSSISSYGSQNVSSTEQLVNVKINATIPDSPTIVMPKTGRTHCQAFIGADRPREGEYDYFQFQFPPNKRAVGVVIPFFNEEERELRRTLESLEIQSRLVWKQKNLSMHVLLIMDGWSKAADSMRDYIKFMFPAANQNFPWWGPLEDPKFEKTVETFFLQRVVPYGKRRANRCVALGDVPISPGSKEKSGKERTLYISLIIKRDNRRKHNSHEWFFGRAGFAEFYKHEYLFATDCGTLFEDDCLASLLSYMESNPTVSVATGRQRVMSRAQQGSKESLISLDTLFRMAQCYDYESSFACFMGAFALFGFLPVIPGPCGLYRAADILGQAADWYFDVVNTDPDKSGMVLGNLRIAEDRVLSYAAVLKTAEPRRMALIPEATFYFEAECSLEKFLLQRRRWTNGTVAGYIYMCLLNPGILWGANMNPLRKLVVYILLFCQLLVYAVVAVAPAIFLVSLHSTFGSIFPEPNFPQTYPEYIWYLCIALYVGMVIRHTTTKYTAWMFYVLMVITWVIIIGAFWTFGDYVYKHGIGMNLDQGYQFVSIYTVMLVTGVPLAIAFLHSPKSFGLMLMSIIPYYLFLPMLVAWFSAYAFARTWDLTWGNRPASAEHGNMSNSSKVNIEGELKAKAMTLCIFIVMANIAFIFLVQQFQHYDIIILIMAAFIFTFAAIQMVLSIIYFILYYDPRRVIQTIWRVATFPFRKRNKLTASESEDDEVYSPDFKSEFGIMPSSKNVSRTNSANVESAKQSRGLMTSGSKSVNGNEIKKSGSKMMNRSPEVKAISRNSSTVVREKASESKSISRNPSVTIDGKSNNPKQVIEIKDIEIKDNDELSEEEEEEEDIIIPASSRNVSQYGSVKKIPSVADAV